MVKESELQELMRQVLDRGVSICPKCRTHVDPNFVLVGHSQNHTVMRIVCFECTDTIAKFVYKDV